MRNLELELIRAFVAVADHRSMTVAGNALHLTQSAVSQQIMRLERRLPSPALPATQLNSPPCSASSSASSRCSRSCCGASPDCFWPGC